MPIKANGSITFKSYRTTRHDGDYEYPAKGVFEGGSISHVAYEITLPATLKNRVLFDKFIANNPKIPSSDEDIDPVTGQPLLKVYFSFWPAEEQTLPITVNSKLFSHQHDSWTSALGSPMSYNHKFTTYLSPIKATLAPRIPLLNYLFGYQVTLPPFMIFHEGMLKGCLQRRLKNSKTPAELEAIFNVCLERLNTYADKYGAWFKALVNQQNSSHNLFASKSKLKKLAKLTKDAYDELINYTQSLEAELKQSIFPTADMTDEEFVQVLEEFISFGSPEVDNITMPLVEDLDLELLLGFIQKVANNPDKYQYNLWSYSCATVILDMMQFCCKNSNNQALKQTFEYPWYVKWLGMILYYNSGHHFMQQIPLSQIPQGSYS